MLIRSLLVFIFCHMAMVMHAQDPAYPLETAPKNILQAEYFIDDLLPIGSGIAIPLNPQLDINNQTISINTANLSGGYHQLYIRTMDSTGKWSMTNVKRFYVDHDPAYTAASVNQNIIAAEYFIDDLLPIGSGISIPLNPQLDINNQTISINTTNLSGGYHQLYIRTMDSSGKWSMTNVKRFYVDHDPAYTAASVNQNIIAAEYFIDDLLPIGSGISIPLNPQLDINNQTISITTANLSGGYHQLYIRTMDSTGKWSMTNIKRFYVDHDPAYTAASVNQNIIAAEYFIDDLLPIGSGISIPLNPQLDINNQTISINTANLSGGYHQLYIRTMDSTGKWSMTNIKRFYVDQDPDYPLVPVVAPLVEAEYFFDQLQPIGSGTPIILNPANDMSNLSLIVNTASFCGDGFHRLYIRTKDASGKWSMTNTESFEIVSTGNITAYQYFFDQDPGTQVSGNGALVQITSPDTILSLNTTIQIPLGLSPGFHTLFTRTKNDDCIWSITERQSFYLLPVQLGLNIDQYQYYYDEDPGFGIAGNGAVVSVNPDSIYSNTLSVNLPNTLSDGFHQLFVRTRSSDGVWSIAERQPFYQLAPQQAMNINAYQYFFDVDPGLGIAGNGAVVGVNPDSLFSNNLNLNIPTSLTEGFHGLFVRTRSVENVWSIAERSVFYVHANQSSQVITALEYYFDQDPGIGNGIPYSITQNDTIDILAQISTTGLLDGMHLLFVRAKDNQGRWSIVERDTFMLFNGVLADHLNFDGNNDYVALSNGGGINGSTTGTIEMWVKWNGNNQPNGFQSYGAIMGRQENGVFSNYLLALDGPDPNTAKIFWRPYYAMSNAFVSNISPGNGWNHIAIVFDGADHALYINGQLSASINTIGTFSNSTIPLTIGAWTGDGNCYAQCDIDELRIWNTARSQSDIQSSMNCELLTSQNGLVGNYHFNQGFVNANNSGISTLVNATGNGDGNLMNFTLFGASSNWVGSSPIITGVSCLSNDTLFVKIMLEGYYSGLGMMNPVLMNQGIGMNLNDCDSIEVELHDPNNFNLVSSVTTLMQTDGTATCLFPSMNNTYYVVIKHRNSIETWSSNPVMISGNSNYYFTTALSQAYGSNQVQVENGIWALYSGDINQDGVVDGLDYNDWENDSNNFAGGYFSTDLNGDGVVDGLDFIYWEQNSNNFVGAVVP